MMTSRERVACVLNHQKPDRLPVDIGSTASGFANATFFKLKEYFGITSPDIFYRPDETAAYYNDELIEKMGGDFKHVFLMPADDYRFEIDAEGYAVSEWGLKKRCLNGMMQNCDNPLADAEIEDIDTYPWPDPYAPGRDRGLRERAEYLYYHTDYAIAARSVSHGLFELAWELRGMQNFLMDMMADKEFANKLLDKLLEIQIGYYDVLLSACGEYVQIVETADDYGTQTGPFMSPALFEEMILPRRKKLNDFIHSKAPQAKIFHHTCGSVYMLMEDLIACGIEVLNPVQPSAKDMQGEILQPEFGDRLIFHGSIDEQTALVKPMAVLREKIAHQCATLGRDGGYIVAPTSNFQNDMPLENIVNFASIVHEFGTFEK